MANGKTAANPAENPAETSAEKAVQSGTAKSSGRRNGRQNKPQAEAQGRPDKQPERTQVCPGGEHPGARQSASRSGRQGERQNGRTAAGRPENSARQSRSVPEGRPSPLPAGYFYSGDMYGMWECILSVPCSYDFILTAPYFFPEGYTEALLTDLDRSLQAIEAKYELDKKQTDD